MGVSRGSSLSEAEKSPGLPDLEIALMRHEAVMLLTVWFHQPSPSVMLCICLRFHWPAPTPLRLGSSSRRSGAGFSCHEPPLSLAPRLPDPLPLLSPSIALLCYEQPLQLFQTSNDDIAQEMV